MQTVYARGMGPAATAAAHERLDALTTSAVAAQRIGRALVARRRVSRRREAIATLQAFYRGCMGRSLLTADLEKRCHNARQDYGHSCGAFSGDTSGGSGAHCVCKDEVLEGARSGSKEEYTMQLGRVTRCDFPMDERCPGGFDLPNLAAHLWETGKENDGSNEKRPLFPHSNAACRGPHYFAGNGAVFELSVQTVGSMYHHSNRRRGRRQYFNQSGGLLSFDKQMGKPAAPPPQSPPLPKWVPAAVAPETSLARALQCSTLIVNSPSFGSVCARRLFSRIGQPVTPIGGNRDVLISVSGAKQGREAEHSVSVEGHAQEYNKTSSHRQGDRLTHVMVLGQSTIGDAGLSELSSAVRHGRLPRLTSLVIGGPGCRVGPRGITVLASALSSPRCAGLRSLSMSNCCLGQNRRTNKHSCSPLTSSSCSVPPKAATTARLAHASWDCFFRHLQRLPVLSSLSLQNCGLEDLDVRYASIAIQILPAGQLRCLRLDGNCIGSPGLRMLLRALTSRRTRLPALWLRQQRPALVESQTQEVVKEAFAEGLFAEVKDTRSVKTIRLSSVLRKRTGGVQWFRTVQTRILACRIKTRFFFVEMDTNLNTKKSNRVPGARCRLSRKIN